MSTERPDRGYRTVTSRQSSWCREVLRRPLFLRKLLDTCRTLHTPSLGSGRSPTPQTQTHKGLYRWTLAHTGGHTQTCRKCCTSAEWDVLVHLSGPRPLSVREFGETVPLPSEGLVTLRTGVTPGDSSKSSTVDDVQSTLGHDGSASGTHPSLTEWSHRHRRVPRTFT